MSKTYPLRKDYYLANKRAIMRNNLKYNTKARILANENYIKKYFNRNYGKYDKMQILLEILDELQLSLLDYGCEVAKLRKDKYDREEQKLKDLDKKIKSMNARLLKE